MKENLVLSFQKLESPQVNGPIWFCGHEGQQEFRRLTHKVYSAFHAQVKFDTRCLLYRGTSVDRLLFVLSHGVTGENIHEGFWGNTSLKKAMEYGELIVVYDHRQTKESWKEFQLENLSKEDLQGLRQRYNSEEISKDGTRIFFSMFNPERRGKVHYERDHGYYIPGDPMQALKGLILLGNGNGWHNANLKILFSWRRTNE